MPDRAQPGCDCAACREARRIQEKMKAKGDGRVMYDETSVQFKRLWRNLSDYQREILEKHNRVPIRTKKGRLYVMPYSRFHDHTLSGQLGPLAHVTLQVFKENPAGEDILVDHFCAGLDQTHAAINVLAVKLLLEAQPKLYLDLGFTFNGPCGVFAPLKGKTFEETLEVPIDPLAYLTEMA